MPVFVSQRFLKSQTPAKRRKQELTPGIKQKAAMGFEPMNNGFANHRLSPLGHAAEKTTSRHLILLKSPQPNSPSDNIFYNIPRIITVISGLATINRGKCPFYTRLLSKSGSVPRKYHSLARFYIVNFPPFGYNVWLICY
jgi:hypothetical protein